MLDSQKLVAPRLSIYQNAFWVLGATLRDDVNRITELFEQKLIRSDDDIYRKAHSKLSSPRLRILAELTWLPGIPQEKVDQLMHMLHKPSLQIADDARLPTLVRVNLMAAAFQWQSLAAFSDFSMISPSEVAGAILKFSHLMAAIDSEMVMQNLNEDRVISGFSEIRSRNQIDAELVNLRRQYLGIVKDTINRMPPGALVDAMTEAVRLDTSHGESHASTFLDELVDVYQIETMGFLDSERAKITTLLSNIRNLSGKGPSAISHEIAKLEAVTKTWVTVAEPVQLSLKARGLDDRMSQRVSSDIRSLYIDLYNEHDMIDQTRRINQLLIDLFVYVPDVAEQIDKDAAILESISEKKIKQARELAEYAESITYQTEVGGVLNKAKLSISPTGIEWKRRNFPLETITRVRWGAIKHSVNGIPTVTTYSVGFGDVQSEAYIAIADETKYKAFIERLWRAVCPRLMTDILLNLRNEKQLNFGDAIVSDLGVKLTRHKLFGSNEKVFCDWMQIETWNARGSFYIRSKSDKKVYSSMSFIETPNAHVFASLISMLFKNPKERMSSLLE